jgi:Putative auto-transporter adhesin, head GIN domain
MKKNYIILGVVAILFIVIGFFTFKWVHATFFDGLKRDLPPFSKIYSNLPYNITVQEGQKERIEITGENKYEDKIDFEVVSGELKLKNNPRVPVARNGPQILIFKKSINELVLANKGDAKVDSMSGTEINLEAKDKGGITVDNLEAKNLIVTVRDSGDILASGKADTIQANVVNASGKINLSAVEAKTASKKDIGTGTIKFSPNTVVEGEDKPKKK